MITETHRVRLGIWHLLLWTAASGLVLAGQRWLELGDSASRQGEAFEWVVQIVASMVEGAALSGLAVGLFEQSRGRRFPVEPGEWLLVACGATVATDLGAKLAIRLAIPTIEPAAAATLAYLPTAVVTIGVYARAFFASLRELEWGPLFSTVAFSQACMLLAIVLLAVLPFAAYAPIVVTILWAVACGYALLIYPNAILQDVLRRRDRGWFHWTGVVVLPLHLAAYLSGLLIWLPRA